MNAVTEKIVSNEGLTNKESDMKGKSRKSKSKRSYNNSQGIEGEQKEKKRQRKDGEKARALQDNASEYLDENSLVEMSQSIEEKDSDVELYSEEENEVSSENNLAVEKGKVNTQDTDFSSKEKSKGNSIIKDKMIKVDSVLKYVNVDNQDGGVLSQKMQEFRFKSSFKGDIIVLASVKNESRKESKMGNLSSMLQWIHRIGKSKIIKIRNVGFNLVEVYCKDILTANHFLSI